MSPIESRNDVRLVTLIGVAIEAYEELSLHVRVSPEQLLAEALYTVNNKVNTVGEEEYLKKLTRTYPILEEAIK